jgi:hypothetical protein
MTNPQSGSTLKVNDNVVKIFVCGCYLFLMIQIGFAQSNEGEPSLVSPIGAVARSAVLPGWGQFYAHSYFQGSISLMGTGALLVGALMTQKAFQDVYNNEYAPIASNDPKSPEAVFQYNRANQRYKLRQFFLFTAVGVWAYSLIDSYVGANIYNATTKANRLIDDTKRIEKLGVQLEVTPTQFHLGVVKSF